jgi:hypothetical protein
MSLQNPVKLTNCLWVRGDMIDVARSVAIERRSLQELGVRIETLKNRQDHEGLTRLRQIAWKTDDHIVLARLLPAELKVLYPIFKDRGNFSILVHDWWITPYWFTRNARYILYNNYTAFTVRQGLAPFAPFRNVPFLQLPEIYRRYLLTMLAVRLGCLAGYPILESVNWWRRRTETIRPEQMIFMPYAVREDAVPLQATEIKYDFSSLGGTNGIWFMRDPFAPSYFTGANLYADRRRLIDLIMTCKGDPFQVYDVRTEDRFVPWEEYCQITRQSRFTLATGGLHHNAVPKFLESACLGTPMIGRSVPFEFPWLDQCLFLLDPASVTRHNIRAKLSEALSLYPKLRENCLNLRESLLRLYSFENLLRMAQDQIDGKPIPHGYLTLAAHPGKTENRA